MKHKFLIIALLASLPWACQEADLSVDLADIGEASALSNETVTHQEVATLLEHLFPGKNHSRAAHDYTMVPIASDGDTPDFFIVNYREGGFALVSAAKTYTPVLAYSESGNFYGLGDMPPALACWMENISREIRLSKDAPDDSVAAAKAEWAAMGVASQAPPQSRMSISNELYHRLRDEIDDSIYSWHLQGGEAYRYDEYVSRHPERDFSVWDDEIESSIFIEYMEDWRHLCVVVERGRVLNATPKGSIEQPWDQGYPFNRSFPILSNGRRAYVGCTNVAGALVMNYFRHPANIQWDKFNSSDNYAALSEFLYQLSIDTSSKYGPGGTNAGFNDLATTLNYKYGYRATHRPVFSMSYLTFPSIIHSNYTQNDEPCDHAWVVSDAYTPYLTYTLEVWTFHTRNGGLEEHIREDNGSGYAQTRYYVNWGWGGTYNGRYVNIASCTPPNTQFNHMCEIITDIRPNR